MQVPKQLKEKQLAELFSVYRGAFPTWQSDMRCSFFRMSGPVRQLIFAEALQSGEYRIANAVDLLFPIPDGCSIIHMFLSVRYREVSPRRHDSMWPKVLVQIEKEFQPPVREVLNMEHIVTFVEEDPSSLMTFHRCVGLASLHAFLGHRAKAKNWCQRSIDVGTPLDRPPAGWETRKLNFVSKLQEALSCGRELELLDPAGLWR
jgi:hypothetical protein